MTFLRRGNVAFPHHLKAKIDLTRIDGCEITVYLRTISCFEEYALNPGNWITKVYFTNGSSIAVAEDFDDVDAACKKWEVANV